MIKSILAMLLVATQPEEVVNYGGERIVYLLPESRVMISGRAWVSYKDLKVEADSIVYDIEHRLLSAYRRNPNDDSGSDWVRFRTEKDSLLGSELHYNLNTRRGVMKDGTTQIQEGYFWGREVWLVRENVLNVTDAYYTTCNLSTPHSCFYAPKLKVYLNNTAIAEPVVLKVGEVPVAVAPFWFFPIARQRKSGLLPFRVGASANEGRFAKGISYYWVLNDYADLTFALDVLERKGWKPQVEGIYIVNPWLRGQFLASYIDEWDTRRRRWSLNANHSSIFPLGMDLLARADFQSDEGYGRDYAEDEIQWLRKELYSFTELSRSFNFASARLLFEQRRDFELDTRSERLPQLSVSLYPRQCFPTRGEPRFYNNIYLSGSGRYLNLSRVAPDRVAREQSLGGDMGLSFNQGVGGVSLSSGLRYNHTLYKRDTLYHEAGYSLSLGANLNLYRVYGVEALGMKGLLHRVSPAVSYSFVPETERRGFYSRPIWSRGRVNRLEFQVAHLFQGKFGKGRKEDLLRLDTGTGYDFLAEARPIAPLRLGIELPSIRRFQIRFNGAYDLYERLTTYSLNTRLDLSDLGFTMGGAGYTLRLEHFYSREANNLSLSLSFKPTRHWSVEGRTHFDLREERLVDYSLQLLRDLHCWEFLFSTSGFGDRWVYDFKLRLKALPDVTIGKGILGFLLPG